MMHPFAAVWNGWLVHTQFRSALFIPIPNARQLFLFFFIPLKRDERERDAQRRTPSSGRSLHRARQNTLRDPRRRRGRGAARRGRGGVLRERARREERGEDEWEGEHRWSLSFLSGFVSCVSTRRAVVRARGHELSTTRHTARYIHPRDLTPHAPHYPTRQWEERLAGWERQERGERGKDDHAPRPCARALPGTRRSSVNLVPARSGRGHDGSTPSAEPS